MSSFTGGLGPLFGPDFVLVTVNDETGQQYQLEVYPDANNPILRNTGLPCQYYYQPASVYLAKKQDSPQDFDFGMTVFKGLATDETVLGLQPGMTVDGVAAIGGGFCSFTTTFAVPPSVITGALAQIKQGGMTVPDRLGGYFFSHRPEDPEPTLGIVPISNSTVTIEIPDLVTTEAGTIVPMYISAPAASGGSIEAHGDNSFLVTCNQFAAGAIAGSLQRGVSPFVIKNSLTEAFYINGVDIEVDIDLDKVYDSFSGALKAGGFLGIDSFAANVAWSECTLDGGGITTKITQNDAVLPAALQTWITNSVNDLRTQAMNLAKEYIFDWDPTKTDGAPASTDRDWFSNIFGGVSVAMKANYERRSIHVPFSITLNESYAVTTVVSGTLNDLLPAVKADPDKYIVIVDINAEFQIVVVSGISAINFAGTTLSDGTVIKDPIISANLSVNYPQLDTPLGPDGKPNLRTYGDGFHYTIATKDPKGPVSPATWGKDNGADIIKFEVLRLDHDIAAWPTDQVQLTQTLVYDGDDPRVNISPSAGTPGTNGLVVVTTQQTLEHTPQLTAAMVGYVHVKFMLNTVLPTSNISISITPTIGNDTYPPTVITKANQTSGMLWEVFSDKYIATTEMSYTVAVSVMGTFPEPSVEYAGQPVTVKFENNRNKFFSPLIVAVPAPPADQAAQVTKLIQEAAAQASSAAGGAGAATT